MITRTGSEQPTQTFSAWLDSIALLWLGQSVSFVGSAVTTFAVPLVAALTLRAPVTDMGYLYAAITFPNIISSAVAGPLADRITQRTLLVALDASRGVLVCAVPVLAVLGWLSMPSLMAVAVLLGAGNALGEITAIAFVPAVAGDKLMSANSRLEGSYSVSQAVGPGLGGLLVQAFGAPFAMLADGASFLFSAVVTRCIPVKGEPKPREEEGDGYFAALREGARHVRNSRPLLVLAGSSCMFNLFSSAAAAVFTFYIVRVLAVSSLVFGLALAASSVGGIAAAATAGRMTRRLGIPNVVGIGLLIAGLGDLVLLACQHRAAWDAVVIAAAQLVASAGVTYYIVTNTTLRQTLTPRHMLGGVLGLLRAVSRGATPVGALVGVAITAVISIRADIAIAGIGQLLVGIGLLGARQLLTSDRAPNE